MQNPFKYGGVVSQDSFCNREQERSDLLRAIENSEKLFVYSERRLGKTSLIRLVQESRHSLRACADLGARHCPNLGFFSYPYHSRRLVPSRYKQLPTMAIKFRFSIRTSLRRAQNRLA